MFLVFLVVVVVVITYRPAPRVVQPRSVGGGNGGNAVGVPSNSGSVKSPRALGGVALVAGSSTAPSDAITRGEADGSPAPLSTDSAAGAGSETPSLTSPTSTTSTTSLSPLQHQQPQHQQQPSRGSAEGRRGLSHKDYDSEDDMGHPLGASSSSRMVSHKDDPSAASARVAADDTDQGESDLDSPN